MSRKYPNPWNFEEQLPAPKTGHQLEYDQVGEIAMSSPLIGDLYLILNTGEKIHISKSAGGPAIWDKVGLKAAYPVWTKTRSQQLQVLDIAAGKIITYAQVFRVLDLERFEGDVIIGVDSPIYQSVELQFDLMKAEQEDITAYSI